MHEMSIAISIVEIAEEETRKAGASRVQTALLEVGKQSGVVLEALRFALEEAVKDTVLDTAHIDITEIDASARCNQCGTTFPVDDFFTPCPGCGSFETETISGKELKIKSLVVD